MIKSHKRFVLALLAAAAPIIPAAAHAQATQAGSVSEVVVTAQKRSEKLVNVPVSMVAISGASLAKSGVSGVLSLAQSVPGLRVDLSGSFVEPSIRGVGTEISGPGSNPNVPIYVDGVVRPNMLADDLNFIDVDSIQVLKGPQGTFYGRNATGGAILITTKAPSFTPELDAKVGYGSFNTATANLFATGPILGDKLAGSIAGQYQHSDGWIYNVLTNKQADISDTYTVRGKLLYAPTDTMKFTLIGDIGRVNDPYAYATTPYQGLSLGAELGGPIITGGNGRNIDLDAWLAHIQEQEGVELVSEFNLGFATLKSYTAGRWQHGQEFLDVDGSAAAVAAGGWHETAHTWSQELDLSHSGGALDWVTGLYYYHDNDGQRDPGFVFIAGGGAPALLFSDFQVSESYAVFADGTYNWDKWHFTLGGRVGEDTAAASYTSYAPPPAVVTTAGTATFGSFSPRVVVRYSVTPDSNVYVSFSQGNKAGLFNAAGLNGGTAPVKPEKLTDFEGGYKIARPTWNVDVDAFHYDYKNLQIQTVTDSVSHLENAPASEMYGVDFDGRLHVTHDLTLSLGASWIHAVYTNFKAPLGALEYVPDPVIPHAIDTITEANVDGDQMERTPEFSGDFGFDYTHPLLGGLFEFNGDYSYQTRIYFDVNQGATQGAYGVLNLRGAWTDPSKHFTVSISGRNVTDQSYLTQVLEQSTVFSQSFGEPASVMAEIEYKY